MNKTRLRVIVSIRIHISIIRKMYKVSLKPFQRLAGSRGRAPRQGFGGEAPDVQGLMARLKESMTY